MASPRGKHSILPLPVGELSTRPRTPPRRSLQDEMDESSHVISATSNRYTVDGLGALLGTSIEKLEVSDRDTTLATSRKTIATAV